MPMTNKSLSSMSKSQSSLFYKILLPIAAGIVFYILMCIWSGLEDLRAAFSRMNPAWIIAVLALAFSNYLLRYVKFHYYLRVLDIRIPPSTGLLVFLASFVMAITPGKLGEVLKSVFLKDLTGVSKSRTAPIVVAERITDLLAFVGMTLIGISGFTSESGVLIAVAITFVLIVVFCLLIGSRRYSMWLLGLMARLPFLRRVEEKLHAAYESTSVLLTPKRLLVAVLISIPSWSCEVVAFWLVCYALASPISIGAAFFIYSVGTILGAVAFLPGGLGLTEASITGMLIEILKMPKAIATSATLLIRLCTLWFAVILGGALILIFRDRLGGTEAFQEVVEEAQNPHNEKAG